MKRKHPVKHETSIANMCTSYLQLIIYTSTDRNLETSTVYINDDNPDDNLSTALFCPASSRLTGREDSQNTPAQWQGPSTGA